MQPTNAANPGGVWTGRAQRGYGGIQTTVAKLAQMKSVVYYLPLQTKNTGKGTTEEEKFLGFKPSQYALSGRSDERAASNTSERTAPPRTCQASQQYCQAPPTRNHDDLQRALEEHEKYPSSP